LFYFSSKRRHTRSKRDWSSDVCSSDLVTIFISSHLLSEIAKIATTIGMIHEGQLIEEMNANKLNQLFHQRLIIDTNHNKSAISKLITIGYNASLNDQGY